MERCTSFPPVYTPDCRVLVLGSMPGVVSLCAGQYYAHARNAFWPIVYGLWGQSGQGASYEDRLRFALDHRIALWDSAKTCLREGSGDAAVRNASPNDFGPLFARCPGIHTVCFNGRLAAALFEKSALSAAGARRRIRLPSTSPAHTLPFDQKLAAWRVLREMAEQES